MLAFGSVEALDVVGHVSFGFLRGSIGLRAVRSVVSEEKKLSIAALSQTLPGRLIEQINQPATVGTARWCIGCRDRSDAAANRLSRRHVAITKTCDELAVIATVTDQPTTRLENRSTATAT